MNFDPQLLMLASDYLTHIASEYTLHEFARRLELAACSDWQTMASELKPTQNVFMNPGLAMLGATVHKLLESIFETQRAIWERQGVSFEGLTSDKFTRAVLDSAGTLAANIEGPSLLERKTLTQGDQT